MISYRTGLRFRPNSTTQALELIPYTSNVTVRTGLLLCGPGGGGGLLFITTSTLLT
jgi:hypothetical protein